MATTRRYIAKLKNVSQRTNVKWGGIIEWTFEKLFLMFLFFISNDHLGSITIQSWLVIRTKIRSRVFDFFLFHCLSSDTTILQFSTIEWLYFFSVYVSVCVYNMWFIFINSTYLKKIYQTSIIIILTFHYSTILSSLRRNSKYLF